jgi:hypothetical protein
LITLCFLATGARAASPNVVEMFACNLNEGKTMADLDKVLAAYPETVEKIGSPEMSKSGANIWLPYRGSAPYDFIWVNNNWTLEEWGKGSLAWDMSKAGPELDVKFFDVATCPTSGVATNEMIFQTKQQLKQDGDILLESYGCKFRPGKTAADSDQAIATWKPVFERAVKGASVVMRRFPILPGQFDLMYLAVWDDTAAYAEASSAFLADSGSAASNEALNEVQTCTAGLWKSRTVKTRGM